MSYATSMQELHELHELRRQQRRERRRQRQGVAFRAQTYRNILYLFASFPLGSSISSP